ncbi:hypothetical protein [Agreia sp. COWG]|uniref:hypothetical protein n=1 Tax=Agreia sp. COWG TaxID=2773266 RepID=UPI001925D0D5|nr:hypothetical protein [Agreia sp. COWG]CAD5989883.1 protein of unknown function [Agreia sp. COWG]
MEQELPDHLTPEAFEVLRNLDEAVAAIHPALRTIYEENFEDGSIPTPLMAMAEYTFWATVNRLDEPEAVYGLLSFLERTYSEGDPVVTDCIALMLLENLVGEPEMIDLLGPRLRDEMTKLTGI